MYQLITGLKECRRRGTFEPTLWQTKKFAEKGLRKDRKERIANRLYTPYPISRKNVRKEGKKSKPTIENTRGGLLIGGVNG